MPRDSIRDLWVGVVTRLGGGNEREPDDLDQTLLDPFAQVSESSHTRAKIDQIKFWILTKRVLPSQGFSLEYAKFARSAGARLSSWRGLNHFSMTTGALELRVNQAWLELYEAGYIPQSMVPEKIKQKIDRLTLGAGQRDDFGVRARAA